jgi:hypothetical protein
MAESLENHEKPEKPKKDRQIASLKNKGMRGKLHLPMCGLFPSQHPKSSRMKLE